ncbi:MAG: M48 family metallopeptidase [Steroidobacteraceae bacterium]
MIAGQYFDSNSSRSHAAQLTISPQGQIRLAVATAEEMPNQVVEASVTEVGISERLGNITRRVTFPDGAVFETDDNDALDRALAEFGHVPGVVDWLERRWPAALAALAAVAAITILFIRYGVPALANFAAANLPAKIDARLGAEALEALDGVFFRPTELPRARERELQGYLDDMADEVDDGHMYRLELRRSPIMGANALALPSGIIVMTDELVALSHNDEELIAVLAHEVGHVRRRHALRQILQSAGVSAIAFAVLGDVSSVSALIYAAPALIEAKNSRDFEREADDFAKSWLDAHGIARSRFDDILCRMDERPETEGEGAGDEGDRIGRFLATHPPTEERAHCSEPAKRRTADAR